MTERGQRLFGLPRSTRDVAASVWVENRPPARRLPRVDWSELWAYRELAFFLALRDLKLRYKQTIFGVAWALVQPLAATAIFTVVFGRLVDLPSDGIAYPVFVYVGMVAWTFFSNSVSAAAESLVQQRGLVTTVYFPRLLAPLAAVLPGLLDMAISLTILIGLMTFYGVSPGVALVIAPFWVLTLVAVTAAFGFWLAALNALYRDVRHAVGFLIQLLFFASPIVFPSSIFHGYARLGYALNPLVGVLDAFRWSLLDAPRPPAADLLSLLTAVLLLASGTLYFQHVERRLGERI